MPTRQSYSSPTFHWRSQRGNSLSQRAMMATTKRAATAPRPRRPLTNEQARVLVVRAQGFGDETVCEPFDVVKRLGAIQLDSVNVLACSHEIVPFGRVGPYPLAALHQAIYRE